ncbi:MAG TPA: STAS domain-containing protein [Terriglobales bacterium]|jgi:anti-anti-sigma regulatory factor|nr:STAS domain-containing protein [Terriglobales bacterium]
MFRATVEHDGELVTLRIEGRLSGPCLAELENCWRQTMNGNGSRQVVVDLKEVTFVSSQGKQLLERLCRAGAQLTGDGLMTRALVEQITESVGLVGKQQ